MEDLEIKGNLISEKGLWSVINMLPGFVSSQQHQGSYTVIALLPPLLWKQEKVRNWQSCCVHLGGAVPAITHCPKSAEQWGEYLGRVLTVNIQQEVADTMKEIFGSMEQKRFQCGKFIPVTDLAFYTLCSWSYQELCITSVTPQTN